MPTPPVSRDVTARGVRTRIAELGDGPPLLLLHGFLSSSHAFDDVLEPLAHNFHVVAIDLPGFGDSEKPPPSRFAYTVESAAEVVADVIAALGIGRCHLVGHSLGGGVALTLAAEHPEFVDHLVLVAPWVHPDPLPKAVRLILLPMLGTFVFKQLLGRAMFGSLVDQHLYAPGHAVPKTRVDRYYDAFNSPSAREGAHAFLRGMLDTRPTVARLTRIKAPSLVVWGRADAMLSPQGAPKIVRQLARAQLEFVDSGHSPHEEDPDTFVRLVERFLLNERR